MSVFHHCSVSWSSLGKRHQLRGKSLWWCCSLLVLRSFIYFRDGKMFPCFYKGFNLEVCGTLCSLGHLYISSKYLFGYSAFRLERGSKEVTWETVGPSALIIFSSEMDSSNLRHVRKQVVLREEHWVCWQDLDGAYQETTRKAGAYASFFFILLSKLSLSIMREDNTSSVFYRGKFYTESMMRCWHRLPREMPCSWRYLSQ